VLPDASVNTKLAVHCPAPFTNDEPPVKVITPGWMVADPSGAQASALPALATITTPKTPATAVSLAASFIRFLPPFLPTEFEPGAN
jgi:hypothetical protein